MIIGSRDNNETKNELKKIEDNKERWFGGRYMMKVIIFLKKINKKDQINF